MTWHLFETDEFRCFACATEYIPFKTPQSCPKCGVSQSVETRFVEEIIHGMRFHKKQYGTYTSGVYFVGSLAESIFKWSCQILDTVAERRNGLLEIEDIRSCVDEIDWNDQLHMKMYFVDLLAAVVPKLSEPDDETRGEDS